MQISSTGLDGLFVIDPVVHSDGRGYFLETWKRSAFAAAGMRHDMVQDNLSLSSRGVLRGLHFQNPNQQGKLIYVLQGEIFDVAVDIRRGSPTFAEWWATRLSWTNKRQVYVPEGFAHGFCVLSESALVAYKCTVEYCPQTEMSLAWDDPEIGITWPSKDPILSAKDRSAPRLSEIPMDRLPWRIAGELTSTGI